MTTMATHRLFTRPDRGAPSVWREVAAVCASVPTASLLARSQPAPVEAEPPPPPPPAPADPVALPHRLLADAAAFEAYLERVQATSPAFTSGQAVSTALKDATAYEPHALIRGAVAYAAVAALEDPTFVAQLRAAGNSPENRRLMVEYIIADPAYAIVNFRASDRAAGLAKEALSGAALRLFDEARKVKQSAYDVQRQAWSKQDIADRPGRLAAAEASGAADLPRAEDHVPTLRSAISGAAPTPIITAPPAAPPYTPLVARAIQVAAIAALGEANDANYDRLASVATDETTSTCLHMAKLNLYQCLAVSKPNYEDVFCTGQHAMSDTAACLVKNAGLAVPADTPPTFAPSTLVRTASRHHADQR